MVASVCRRAVAAGWVIYSRHGLVSVAYWTPLDEPLRGRAVSYILKHPSRDAAAANRTAFRADPEWVKVRTASEEKGKDVEKVDSTFMKLTDFSAKVQGRVPEVSGARPRALEFVARQG